MVGAVVLLAGVVPGARGAAPAPAVDPPVSVAPEPESVQAAYWLGTPAADELPLDQLNTVIWSFASPAGGECSVPGQSAVDSLEALADAARGRPDLKVVVAIGGWGAPGFGDAARTPESRRAFVSSCMERWVEAFPVGVVDGFDIDWEFPVSGGLPSIGSHPDDRENLTSLLAEFRRQLSAHARQNGLAKDSTRLSIAVPAGRTQDDGSGVAGAPYDASRSFDLLRVQLLVDYVNLMTYDLCTGYAEVSCYSNPLVQRPGDPNDEFNNVVGAVRYLEERHVPADKIVVGVPFYGRYFDVTSADDDGLYQPWTSTGTVNYDELVGPDYIGDPDFVQGWDPTVQSPYLWDEEARRWVTYENPRSIQVRSVWAKEAGLGGMMMWQIGGDDAQFSLTSAMTGPWLTTRAGAGSSGG